ncbi:hypothetical protein MHAS44199_18290 [Mycolicibacterium hassiacum DSM 44199]|nr:hypothetical protein [Mycolicibacterium hassiacum DSM 44199]
MRFLREPLFIEARRWSPSCRITCGNRVRFLREPLFIEAATMIDAR